MAVTKQNFVNLAARAIGSGLAASALSAAALLWRGSKDNGAPLSGLNAPSHWLWGDEALRHAELSRRYTAWGAGIHQASSLLWSTVYELAHQRHRRPHVGTVVCDAVLVTAVAAVVDLKLVPQRLTPGFERRLSARSLIVVYGGFALGLAVAGLHRLAKRA